jgi:glycosyltransferase involved in cell wall biosynthesis
MTARRGTTEGTALAGSRDRGRTVAENESTDRPLRILHLIIVLGETNSQYNEHCLPVVNVRDLSICTYFRPKVAYPAEIGVFAGDDTLRGFFRALGSALDAKEFDVIHAHAPQTGALLTLALAARPSRWRLWRTLAYTVHDSFHDYKFRNKVLMLPPLATFRRVVFCGHAAYDSYPALWKRLVGSRARVVQNAADLDRVERAVAGVTRAMNGSTFRVVSVGRLEKVKDPMTLLAAFRRIGDNSSRLALVGTGSLEAELAGVIQGSRLENRVELTGLIPREDVFARCAHADLFVSSSRGEGLPVAVIEAMATGCPVVLSDIPPHREVADGVDFIPFVRMGDADGFAREIDRFRTMSPGARTAIGLKCRELVKARFSLEGMHAGYEHVYRELA